MVSCDDEGDVCIFALLPRLRRGNFVERTKIQEDKNTKSIFVAGERENMGMLPSVIIFILPDQACRSSQSLCDSLHDSRLVLVQLGDVM